MTKKNSQASSRDNQKNRQQLVLEYYPLVRKIAAKMALSYPKHVEVDDLIQVGVLGLMEAIDRYQPERYPSFGAYARIRIQGAILDNRRAQDWTPRSVRDRVALIQQTKTNLHKKLNRHATTAEQAQFLGISDKQFQRMYRNSEVKTVLSMEHGAEDCGRLGDIIPSQAAGPDEELARVEARAAIAQCISTLAEREQKIINLHYFQGVSFNQISKSFGVSEARISQIHSKIKSKMQGKLSTFVHA